MDSIKPKIVFIDIDGTLVDDDGKDSIVSAKRHVNKRARTDICFICARAAPRLKSMIRSGRLASTV